MAMESILTDLPSELLVGIMSRFDDVDVLLSFTRTCKHLRTLFQQNRRSILYAIVSETIDTRCGVAIEAEECEAAVNIRNSGKILFDGGLIEFLDRYRTKRAQQLTTDQTFQTPEQQIFYSGKGVYDYQVRSIARRPLGLWPGPASDLTYLQKLYNKHMLIRQCVEWFCQGALEVASSESLDEQNRRARFKPLSPTERRRLYRAFYRVELYHQIHHGAREERGLFTLEPSRVRDYVWLCTFPPHEQDEMATVYQWLDDGWRSKFKDIDTGLQTWQERQVYVDEGLAGYLKAMKEDDPARLNEISQRCNAKSIRDLIYLGTCLITNSPFHDLHGPPSSRDGYPLEGTRLSFTNDHIDCPNYAWLWSHKFWMTGAVFHYSHSDIRRIGHVMWDKSRLDTWEIYKGSPPRFNELDWYEEDDSTYMAEYAYRPSWDPEYDSDDGWPVHSPVCTPCLKGMACSEHEMDCIPPAPLEQHLETDSQSLA